MTAMLIDTSNELTVTSTTFHRNVGQFLMRALTGVVVVVTRHHRPLFVLLRFDDYERLKAAETVLLGHNAITVARDDG